MILSFTRLLPLPSALVATAVLSVACGSPALTTPEESSESAESAAARETNATTPSAEPRGTHVGVHGMVLFGSERLYLSHIPLYSSPHNIQVVVEVKIANGVPTDQQQFGTKNFTVRPTAFSLDDLAQGVLRSVTGTIFLGNFESGGTPAFRNVRFDVTRVIFERALSSSTPANPSLDYVAVGTPTQPYLVHVIDAAPSFDQIVAVKLPTTSFLDAASLEVGALVRISGRANTVTTRLKPQSIVEAVDARSPGGTSSGASESTSSTIDVLSENSCLPGGDFFGACPPAQ